MRVFGVVLLLVFVAVPMSLFAQPSGGGGSVGSGDSSTSTSTSVGTSSGSSSNTTVTNVSEQAESQRTFIGSGRPDGFVGVDDMTSSRRSANSTRRPSMTTARPAARSTVQRRTGMMSGTARSTSGSNNQSIRTVTSVDFDVVVPPPQEWWATAETIGTGLSRIQGIQNSQITFKDSPTGTVAVLTGTVASERERRVAKQLLLLEPGINRVENLLEIR